MLKPLIYICAPYRGKTEKEMQKNIEKACRYGKEAYAKGYIPVIPHINSKAIFGLNAPDDSAVVEFDCNLLKRCNMLWVCSSNRYNTLSEGMNKEIEYCRKEDIPIIFARPKFLKCWEKDGLWGLLGV